MPVLSGIVGMEALAAYGADNSLRSYNNITRLATDTGPILGGIALAAILAALVSSGGPILLASATMFVNDWVPGAQQFSNEKKLQFYRVTTLLYGLLAATIAVFADLSSVLKLLLFGFAMVIPPAVAIAFVIYDKSTSEQGAYWGIFAGYATGLIAWLMQNVFDGLAFLQWQIPGTGLTWMALFDPAYWATLVPLLVVPVISRIKREQDSAAEEFYRQLAAN